MDIAGTFADELETKVKILNCLLIHRHYILVMEKKTVDFSDFVESKRSLEEKEEFCKRFAYTRT
jgi:hypothetical protein